MRSGKYLAETATEILVELKPPPQKLFADAVPEQPITCAFDFLRMPQSPSPLASSAQAKNSSGTSVNSTCLRSNPTKNRPTSGSWGMP